MTTYANQLRQLALCLQYDEEGITCDTIPMASIVITLNEAAEKIDKLGIELSNVTEELDCMNDNYQELLCAYKELKEKISSTNGILIFSNGFKVPIVKDGEDYKIDLNFVNVNYSIRNEDEI